MLGPFNLTHGSASQLGNSNITHDTEVWDGDHCVLSLSGYFRHLETNTKVLSVRVISKVCGIVRCGSYFIIQDSMRPLGSLNELFMCYLRMQKWKLEQLLALAYVLYLYESY